MNKSEYHKKKYILRRKFEAAGEWSRACPKCGEPTFYYYRFDAFCCFNCDVWFSSKCNDPNCRYCSQRPAAPSEAVYSNITLNSAVKEWRRKNYGHKKTGEIRHIRRNELYARINERKRSRM